MRQLSKESFGLHIQHYRQLAHREPSQLASEVGMSVDYLLAIERGTRVATVFEAQRIADALDMNILELL